MTAKTTASPSILVVGGTPEQRAWTAHAVRELCPDATAAARLADAPSLDAVDLVIASYNGLHGRDRRALLDSVQLDGSQRPRLLLTCFEPRNWEPLFQELEANEISNLLCLDLTASETELRVTAQKLLDDDIFGLAKYIADGARTETLRVRSSNDVTAAVDAAGSFAAGCKIHPRLIENVATAIDELITNALYNAPVDAHGAPRFAHLPRTSAVELEPHEEVVIELRCNDALFGLSVTDPFGALTRAQTLDYLARCLRRQRSEPLSGKGGAGIGLYITFDALNHLVLNICRGRRTEVLGLIDVRGTYRDFVERGKSFNIFFCPRDET